MTGRKQTGIPRLAGTNFNLPTPTPRQINVYFKDVGEAIEAQRMKDKEAMERFNADVRMWSRTVERALKQSAELSFAHRETSSPLFPRLSDSIEAKVRIRNRQARSIGFALARHGVYQHFGAGTGEGGDKGSRWVNKHNRYVYTREKSLGKMGKSRDEVQWFNDTIDYHIPTLIDLVAEYSTEILINKSAMYIL